MRPDPWQKEKSRRYQAKKKGRGEAVKTSKKGDDKNDKNKAPAVDGGFKFVKPMPAPQPQYEGTGDEDEDEYDVKGLEDVGFDFSSLSIQDNHGVPHHICTWMIFTCVLKEYFSAEELKELDEAVDLEISGLEEMSKWLQDRLEGRPEELLTLEPILIATDRSVDAQLPTMNKAPVVMASLARPRTDPLEDMLDDLLDT